MLKTDVSLSGNYTKMSTRQTPNEFLQQIIGRPVVVKLNSGVDYRGTFQRRTRYSCPHAFVSYLS